MKLILNYSSAQQSLVIFHFPHKDFFIFQHELYNNFFILLTGWDIDAISTSVQQLRCKSNVYGKQMQPGDQAIITLLILLPFQRKLFSQHERSFAIPRLSFPGVGVVAAKTQGNQTEITLTLYFSCGKCTIHSAHLYSIVLSLLWTN